MVDGWTSIRYSSAESYDVEAEATHTEFMAVIRASDKDLNLNFPPGSHMNKMRISYTHVVASGRLFESSSRAVIGLCSNGQERI